MGFSVDVVWVTEVSGTAGVKKQISVMGNDEKSFALQKVYFTFKPAGCSVLQKLPLDHCYSLCASTVGTPQPPPPLSYLSGAFILMMAQESGTEGNVNTCMYLFHNGYRRLQWREG